MRPSAAVILVALLTSSSTWSQTAPAVDAQTLAKYDKNANGRLDPEELAAMEAGQAKLPKVSTGTAGGAEDVVQMSPFEVSGAGNKGYLASNTLSGTRLNSKLEDLGSSITVVTKEQMQDFALLDVNDIFLYEAGTEGTGNYTAFEIDRNGVVIDNVAADPNNANRVRGIASVNQARGNFATSGRVPLDPIDMDAVEISRGPNSSIFGLGNASGTINIIPASAGLQRPFTRVETRVDSNGSTRGSIDLNRPLLRDTLAVRGSAVFQQDEFQRKPSVVRSKRYNGMLTYRPYPNTTLRGSVQYYEEFARRPNAILPRDGITYWEASGRPTWNAATATVTRNGVATVVPYNNNQGTETSLLGPGLESAGSTLYARPSIFVNPDGTIGMWIVGRQSGTSSTGQITPDSQAGNARIVESAPWPKEGALWQATPSLTDRSRYDWTSINLAAPNWLRSRNHLFTVELEQFFFRTGRHLLGMQLGWNREENERYTRNFIGQSGNSPMVLYADVNTTLPDGTINPYFGRPYMNASEPSINRNPWFRDSFRAQLAYQINLSREKNWMRWIGDHTASAYGEYKNTTTVTFQYRDVIVDEHSWIAPGAAHSGITANRGYYRYYVGDANGGNVDYSPPDWQYAHGTYGFRWYNAGLGQWVTEPSMIGEAYNGGARRFRNIIKTQGGVLQDHFLRDRIVTTFGWRKDSNFNRNSVGTAVGPDGLNPDYGTGRTWAENWLRRDGRTKTAGIVVKPLRNFAWVNRVAVEEGVIGFLGDAARSFSVYYNKSDSFVPQPFAHNLIGEMLPDPGGVGKDYGFSVSLFKERIVIRYNEYNNVQENSRVGDSGTIASRASRLDFSATTGGTDNFNLYRNELSWVRTAHPDWTEAQIATEVARQMQLPEDFLSKQNEFPISDTSDVTAKGKEIEVSFNPNRYFRSKLNVTQQSSVDNRLSPAIMQYINSRMAVWQSIIDPTNGLSWWTTKYRGTSPEDFYLGSVLGPYKLAVANEGRTKPQIREWRMNALGALQLAAISDNRWLKRVSVSGAVRWEDKSSIGYYTLPDDPNAYDANRPIFDKPRTYFDAGASYVQKIYNNRITMRLQLNVRNLTEDGRIQAVGALPNGQPHSFRIIDPRLFILTASFDI